MGASGKWIKSLVGLRAPSAAGKGRKWSRLWRNPSSSSSASGTGGRVSPTCEKSSSLSESSVGAFSSVVATVVRAPPRDFRVIRQEWAAIRVQAAFRAFLARRALKALRGIVRLQALVRGRLVRRKFAVTLDRMQALLRVQERAMERRARSSADGGESHDALSERNGRADPVKQAEEQWCDRHGSVSEVRSKIQMRHEAAVKRERAIAYSLSHQPRSLTKHGERPSSPAIPRRNHEFHIEGWMATKPWESRLMDQNHGEFHGLKKNSERMNLAAEAPKPLDAGSVKIIRNNIATRVEAKAPPALSASSSDFMYNDSASSTSSVTPGSVTNILASSSETRSDTIHGGGPGYMSLTKSAKARLNGCNSRGGQFQLQRQGSGGMSCYKRAGALSSLDAQSNAGSEMSVTSRRLKSMSLKAQSMTRSLDLEN